MLFEIAGDCLPRGDWDRAELGDVDPFRYLDVAYAYGYLFRSEAEVRFLQRAAALNLLCRLARIAEHDDTTGLRRLADFRHRKRHGVAVLALRAFHPELFAISEAFEGGRVVPVPAIQRAFRAALYGEGDMHAALASVTAGVVLRTFQDSHPPVMASGFSQPGTPFPAGAPDEQ